MVFSVLLPHMKGYSFRLSHTLNKITGQMGRSTIWGYAFVFNTTLQMATSTTNISFLQYFQGSTITFIMYDMNLSVFDFVMVVAKHIHTYLQGIPNSLIFF